MPWYWSNTTFNSYINHMYCMHAQSCATLCNHMDHSLPGSSVHRILQARLLEWVASSRGIFPTQGSNTHLLHRQAVSLPLCPLGSPAASFMYFYYLQCLYVRGLKNRYVTLLAQDHEANSRQNRDVTQGSPIPTLTGFPVTGDVLYGTRTYHSNCGSVAKSPPASAGDTRAAGSIPGSGGSPGEGNATRSNILAWKISWTEEPGGLQSLRLQSWTRFSN